MRASTARHRISSLDGARYLEQNGWPARLCGLVGYHSGAYFVAVERGVGDEMRHLHDEGGAIRDAITYADQTTGPTGKPVIGPAGWRVTRPRRRAVTRQRWRRGIPGP